MTEHTHPIADVETIIRCDATGCERSIVAQSVTQYGPLGSRELAREGAQAEGWSAWAGRGQRHYCGEHRPRPGHRMRRVWGPSLAGSLR